MKSLRPLTRPAPATDAIDYRSLAELRHQIRLFLAFSEREARAAGVEPQQHQLLLAVRGLPEAERPTIAVLAERLQLKHHTVVGLVDRLEASGLAARRPSASDRREILVAITRKGERLLQKLSLAHRAELDSAGHALLAALEAVLVPHAPRARSTARAARSRP